jgi:phage FluMu gp28-like protein
VTQSAQTVVPYRDPVDEGGPLFHRYQTECAELALSVNFLVIEKSRRIGISWCLAGVACLIASPKTGARNVFYMAYNFEMTRTFIDDCAEFLRAFHEISAEAEEFLYDDGGKDIKAFRIDLPSGKSIIALSSNPRSLRSKQGVAIIDEAGLHDDLDAVIAAALPLTMLGGSVIVLSTHYGADNPFNTLLTDIRSGRRGGTALRITLQDALNDGFYKRICATTGKIWSQKAEDEWQAALRHQQGESAEEEFDCVPAQGGGVYMARATIEAAMSPLYPVIRLKCPVAFERGELDWRSDWIEEWLQSEIRPLVEKFDPTRSVFFGQDYARSNDLSVLAFGQYDATTNLICHFIIEMRNVPSREQLQILDFILGRVHRFGGGKVDARGNGQDVAAYLQDHYGADRIEGIMATVKTYLAMMPRLKARIEDRTITIPRSEGVIDDLRLIKLVKGVPMVVDRSEDRGGDRKDKRHGDAAIALMHLVAAADEDAGPVDFHSGGPRPSSGLSGEFISANNLSIRRTINDDFSL